MKCHSLFSRKKNKKTIIHLSSAEIFPSMLSVNENDLNKTKTKQLFSVNINKNN